MLESVRGGIEEVEVVVGGSLEVERTDLAEMAVPDAAHDPDLDGLFAAASSDDNASEVGKRSLWRVRHRGVWEGRGGGGGLARGRVEVEVGKFGVAARRVVLYRMWGGDGGTVQGLVAGAGVRRYSSIYTSLRHD